MLRVLRHLISVISLVAIISAPAQAMFIQSDWLNPTEPGVGTNRYAYSFNDPVNNLDPGGNACVGANGGGGFCRRANLYGKFHEKFKSQTSFFGAASQTTEMLAAVDIPGGAQAFTSGKIRTFLRDLSGQLESLNVEAALAIERGQLSVPDLNSHLVSMEQSAVQAQLDALKESNPVGYQNIVSEVNGLLNPSDSLTKIAGSFYGSDAIYQGVLDGVRESLGENIDFANQAHREAIGNALIDRHESIQEQREQQDAD